MGDKHAGLAVLVDQIDKFPTEVLRSELVEGAEGLIAEDDVWVNREPPCDTHPLLHPARELVGVRVFVPVQAEALQPPTCDLGPLFLRHANELEPEADILERGAPGHQPIVLEDDS
jgi:hypothetical protein